MIFQALERRQGQPDQAAAASFLLRQRPGFVARERARNLLFYFSPLCVSNLGGGGKRGKMSFHPAGEWASAEKARSPFFREMSKKKARRGLG